MVIGTKEKNSYFADSPILCNHGNNDTDRWYSLRVHDSH